MSRAVVTGAAPVVGGGVLLPRLQSLGLVMITALSAITAFSAITALAGVMGLAMVSGSLSATELAASELPDPLDSFGLSETTGAAPGYVEDRACAFCHTDIFESYQDVGMARSFFRPREELVIEDFRQEPYHHEPSRRFFEMSWKDGGYLFRRYQVDEAGREVNVFEQPVDWVLGSGSTSRTYLFQNPTGELFQLPLSWYSQSGEWRLAPGYDHPDHDGVTRRVRRECMFCHNAYPEVEEGADLHWSPQTFPKELPEGTGCQRCHGPGAEHVRQGLQDDVNFEALLASIVNPGDLPRERRDDVCHQCHLQPSVAISGLRRFGRGDYSFRPGQALSEYQVPLDVEEESLAAEDRFEINHHPYRLRQSRCFLESEGALGCLTCHDPHRKVAEPKRARHYREACLTCHQLDSCSLEPMTAEQTPGAGQVSESGEALESLDCVSCHMPRRRTQDVVHVVMTDHKIQRTSPGKDLLAALKERDPILTEVYLLEKEGAPTGVVGEIYRAVAVMRKGDSRPADYLKKRLSTTEPGALELGSWEPYLDLAQAQLRSGNLAEAEATLAKLLKEAPDLTLSQRLLLLLKALQGHSAEALEMTKQQAKSDPSSPETQFNLALQLLGAGQNQKVLMALDRVLALRPHQAKAWFYRGYVLTQLQRSRDAVGAYRRALEIDPGYERAYLSLARAYRELKEEAAAASWLRLGLANVADSGELAKEVARLPAP